MGDLDDTSNMDDIGGIGETSIMVDPSDGDTVYRDYMDHRKTRSK